MKETKETLELRYREAIKKIGVANLLELPEQVKKVLQGTSDFEAKVKMLELIVTHDA